MTGTLTITSQPGAREPAPRAPAAAHASMTGRPHLGAQPQPSREVTVDRLRPEDADRLEARRLKALVSDPGLRISMYQDEASGRVVMQVVSRATGEVVEQIPAEALLRLYSALREPLLDERV
jgi:uncharacterized FlaG/YvyC family protein